ncbi:MAG: TIGR02466 family protein [Pseudomonadota bacterium]
MTTIDHVFPTTIYRARLFPRGTAARNEALAALATSLGQDDEAGLSWSEAHDYGGYTSYASLNDLPWRFPEFQALKDALDVHVAAFADAVHFDLGGEVLALDSLWVNLLVPGGHHAAHLHPHSVVSGTYYVSLPKGTNAIRFEDPRHAMMMAAPQRRASAPSAHRPFLTVKPKAGDVLLWESWLRHDVPTNESDELRISVSFNYGLGRGPTAEGRDA